MQPEGAFLAHNNRGLRRAALNGEGGYSRFDALFAPVLVALPLPAALWLSLFVITDQPWWGRLLLVPAIPLALFLLFLNIGINRCWPRALRELSELERQLPHALDENSSLRERFGAIFGGWRR